MLLRCLLVMENVTFLSEQNQVRPSVHEHMIVCASSDVIIIRSAAGKLSGYVFCVGDAYEPVCDMQSHLLELRLPRGSKDAPDTFIALIIATIKLLSGEPSLTRSIFRSLVYLELKFDILLHVLMNCYCEQSLLMSTRRGKR